MHDSETGIKVKQKVFTGIKKVTKNAHKEDAKIQQKTLAVEDKSTKKNTHIGG